MEGDRKIWFGSFNSSLVRLGVHVPPHGRPCLSVSIPAWYDWEAISYSLIAPFTCFNSSLVRLGDISSQVHPACFLFQFQLGTIGSFA